MRQAIDIERLLCWAYRDELPKRDLSASGWDSVAGYLARGGVAVDVDPWEAYLRPQRYAYIGPPHRDAIMIEAMVARLEDAVIEWPAAQSMLLGELAPYLTPEAERIIRRLRAHTAGLVRAHARMGTRPMWDVYWRLGPMLAPNNRPIVQYIDRHGRLVICHGGKREWLRGGRCPLRLYLGARPGERDRLSERPGGALAEIASARWEYLAWHAGLCALVTMAESGWQLDRYRPLPPRAARVPWRDGVEPQPRILSPIEPS